jgi:hypothetical protein
LRANASANSRAELDASAEIDIGDIAELADDHAELLPSLPNLQLIGGCRGTDHRHIAVIKWHGMQEGDCGISRKSAGGVAWWHGMPSLKGGHPLPSPDPKLSRFVNHALPPFDISKKGSKRSSR